MFQKSLTFRELGIGPADVWRQIGYRTAADGNGHGPAEPQPDPQVRAEVASVIDAAATIAQPQLCYTVKTGTLDASAGLLTVDGSEFHIGKIIGRQLLGAEAFAFFVVTAGREYEQWRQQADLVRTYIADALGSVMAEATADRMEEVLQASIDKLGWRHTNRFSPGYCGWHVEEQQRLFPLFGQSAPCGVTLTESSLMWPIKSVSGIIGLGQGVRRLDYTCGLCGQKNCLFKKSRKKS